MAANLNRVSFALQRANEEALRTAGFRVKNTFIDEAGPLEGADESPESAQPGVRRAITAPVRQLCLDEELEEEEYESASDDTSDVQGCPLPHCVSISSDTSTATPTSATDSAISPRSTTESGSLLPLESVSSPSSASPKSESPHEESKLAALVRRECAFLRITGCSLGPTMPRTSKRKPQSMQCLRICVVGLPSLKRHKWQQPLAWAVACTLERAGCPASVRRGELFAALNAEEGGEMVRVDLCAPRAGDLNNGS